jgi:hypothetical protein
MCELINGSDIATRLRVVIIDRLHSASRSFSDAGEMIIRAS